jgi:hypothetical protein
MSGAQIKEGESGRSRSADGTVDNVYKTLVRKHFEKISFLRSKHRLENDVIVSRNHLMHEIKLDSCFFCSCLIQTTFRLHYKN